ncbi:AAA ATPase-like protein [Aureococcus anophagefferens]|nr:AAA ATPase-like protein [Aureococcus anophagefferens]
MTTTFDDVAGLQAVKLSIMEMIILPMQRPELFTGLRAQPKGMLLFGPPGTGKTLVGRAIASSSGAKFFSISASSLMSKWTGESEQLVATMFAMARHNEPSVVFIDEVDSLLSQRSSGEEEASRRVKTQFLNELDGVRSGDASNRERVLVVGATNRPQELDEAARRRFVKRFSCPCPATPRAGPLRLAAQAHPALAVGRGARRRPRRPHARFSGADIHNLCGEAAMGPMRDVGYGESLAALCEDQIPPISFAHFDNALKITRATVAPEDLTIYELWDQIPGPGVAGSVQDSAEWQRRIRAEKDARKAQEAEQEREDARVRAEQQRLLEAPPAGRARAPLVKRARVARDGMEQLGVIDEVGEIR